VAVIAGLDYLLQRFQFLRQQRMTKQEVKDEFKQTEGDPAVKGRLKQIRMDRARRRIMASWPRARSRSRIARTAAGRSLRLWAGARRF